MSESVTTEQGIVTVTIGEKGFASEVSAGGHTLAADEPVSLGGEDTGPSPYDLLLSALGSCKAMTMRMYADRKGWFLGGAEITLRHKRVHAADCADCDTKQGKIDRIEVKIALKGDLTADQRDRLLEIADMCPVHRTLTSETKIVSALVE